MQAKDWGQENWRDLLRQIAATYPGYSLVILGAKEDRAVGDNVLSDWNGPKIPRPENIPKAAKAGIQL